MTPLGGYRHVWWRLSTAGVAGGRYASRRAGSDRPGRWWRDTNRLNHGCEDQLTRLGKIRNPQYPRRVTTHHDVISVWCHPKKSVCRISGVPSTGSVGAQTLS